jgi:hypothetical protein
MSVRGAAATVTALAALFGAGFAAAAFGLGTHDRAARAQHVAHVTVTTLEQAPAVPMLAATPTVQAPPRRARRPRLRKPRAAVVKTRTTTTTRFVTVTVREMPPPQTVTVARTIVVTTTAPTTTTQLPNGS